MLISTLVLPLPDRPDIIMLNGNLGMTPSFIDALSGVLDLSLATALMLYLSPIVEDYRCYIHPYIFGRHINC